MTNTRPDICPNCHSSIRHLTTEQFCPFCGNGIPVNNKIPAIFSDEKIYHIFVEQAQPGNSQHIRAIAQITNKNFLQSKRLATQSSFEIFSGRAYAVLDIIDCLNKSALEYRVEPYFGWTKDDTEGIKVSR